jgi:hypothetical protein
MKIFRLFIFISGLLNVLVSTSIGQQVPDTLYTFPIARKAYPDHDGPVIFIDEAHNNFHTINGGFYAFGKLLALDGYQVKGLDKAITGSDIIQDCRILVIANALNDNNVDRWIAPTPSAFTNEEISAIKRWVYNGGNLLLIADHMPFAGAAYELGKAFGFEFINGYAFTSAESQWPPSVFYLKKGTLKSSPVTSGFKDDRNIDSVATFTGSAFKAPGEAIAVLSFLEEHFSLQPDTAWRFHDNTAIINLAGYCQGALLEYGKGRVAVFGEAAMFTAQIANGTFKVGFNSDRAPQNAQFTLNLIHWLDGLEE